MSSRDALIDMPTDLHTPRSALELDDMPTTQPKPPGITRLTVSIPSSSSYKGPTAPSRWNTLEFYVYYVIFAVAIPMMVYAPVRLSDWRNPNSVYFRDRLHPGWILGRPIDNSDAQYRSFRNNLPALLFLTALFLGLKRAYTHYTQRPSTLSIRTRHGRTPFIVAFAMLMLAALHGASLAKIMLILGMNYAIAKGCGGRKVGVLLTWVFNALVLYLNERQAGWRYAQLSGALSGLDAWQGFYPRWHISFNITMLRLVSFNMDYYWACSSPIPARSDTEMAEKQRKTTAHALSTYSFVNYVAYVLYPPLYIAGPIITFNDFMWQMHRPVTITRRAVASYAFRFATCLLTMEFILHFMYVVAIKDARAWEGDTPFELSMVGFWNLMIVWLKLLLPWRFFRLWALLDGLDPPENMVRCMANNYSPLGFWRAWHRSYNLWIVRYIYIPLGGTQNAALSMFLIFSFVALWHDLSFRLLAWGWLVSVFILPELGARYVLPGSKYGQEWWYRHVCALGAVVNILFMMAANLVGFVIGTDGMKYMLEQLVGTWAGIQFMILAVGGLFVGAQLMFEYREEEMRRGIYRRC